MTQSIRMRGMGTASRSTRYPSCNNIRSLAACSMSRGGKETPQPNRAQRTQLRNAQPCGRAKRPKLVAAKTLARRNARRQWRAEAGVEKERKKTGEHSHHPLETCYDHYQLRRCWNFVEEESCCSTEAPCPQPPRAYRLHPWCSKQPDDGLLSSEKRRASLKMALNGKLRPPDDNG